MRALLPLAAVALIAAGCGGDDDAGAASETPATDAAGGTAGAPYDISVGEFIAELQPQKQRILKAFVADSADCDGVKVDPGFVLLVSAAAIDADQEAPLAGLVEEQCG
jgi:hypothetical protein